MTIASNKTVDAGIQEALGALKSHFFPSLEGNANALDSFYQAWANFHDTVQSCCDSLRPDTLQEIHTFATMVDIVASSTMESLVMVDEKLTNDFAKDITKILEEGMNNLVVAEATWLDPEDGEGPPASFIKPCQEWLLANLHNPYPSRPLKEKISCETSSSSRDIDHWFMDARKRIGWNAFRRERFSNQRSAIVNAATQFFKDDPKRCLDPSIRSQFATIQANAEGLYLRSALSTNFAVAMKPTTPEIDVLLKADVNQPRQRRRRITKKLEKDARAYPSPDRSPEQSPKIMSPSIRPCDQISANERPTLTRRRSTSLEREYISSNERLSKRSRIDSPVTRIVSTGGLLSPAVSNHELSDTTSDSKSTDSLLPSITVSHSSTNKRKRRLSDSDCQGFPKRAREMPAGPRLHSASDPIGKFASFDLVSNFIGPSTIEELDFSVPMNIELFDWALLHPTPASSYTEPTLNEMQSFSASDPSLFSASAPETVLDFPCNEKSFYFNHHDHLDTQVLFPQLAGFSSYDEPLLRFFNAPLSPLSPPPPLINATIRQEENDVFDSLSCQDFSSETFQTPYSHPLAASEYFNSPESLDTSEAPELQHDIPIAITPPEEALNTSLDVQLGDLSKAQIEAELQRLNARRQRLEVQLQRRS